MEKLLHALRGAKCVGCLTGAGVYRDLAEFATAVNRLH